VCKTYFILLHGCDQSIIHMHYRDSNNDTVLLICRDSFYLCLLNSVTSFTSGLAIFSFLGYMSQKQGVDISVVAESGMAVHLSDNS